MKLKQQALFNVEKIEEKQFEELLYIFQYEGEIRNLILNYKFKEKNYKYRALVKFIEKNQKISDKMKKYDIIMPVPISKTRKKQRGYNQSDLLASELSRMLKVEYSIANLVKIKENKVQSLLNKEERIKNVENVYYINNTEKVKNKKILLIDDIYTTGSTVNECSKILKQAGANKIGVFAIAKD